jgi:hypothetical protein
VIVLLSTGFACGARSACTSAPLQKLKVFWSFACPLMFFCSSVPEIAGGVPAFNCALLFVVSLMFCFRASAFYSYALAAVVR